MARLIMEITTFFRCFLLLLLYFDCQGCLESERDALLRIKDSMNSPEVPAFSTWYGQECCQWEGVECDPSNIRINKIFFHHWRDQSQLEIWHPNATLFAQFKHLQELELPGNQIGGFISPQAFRKLNHLQKLDLRENSIQDASNLCRGKFPSLYYLDMSGNKLEGNIPECLCDNLFLKELILFDNLLSGSINLCLGNMVSLEQLDLSSNQFNGSLPSSLISNLTNIESLVLSRNEFEGRISLCIFANLSRLSQLDISDNRLEVETETESPSCSPSFSLNSLHLSGCNLTNIPSFLSTQQRLEVLDLSNNSLHGNISPWLLYNIASELWLRGNNLSGPFPRNFQNISSKLTVLDVSDNFLHGPLPKDIGLHFPQLRHLDLSANSFNSKLPPSLGNLSSLVYLRLSRNNLTGDACPKNSSLPKIKWLYLDENYFSGTFPDTLSKSMELEIVDIQNNNLSGELSSFLHVLPKLKALLLGGNRFEGQIPRQLCQMRNLHVLDLSRNSLSGDIPDCVDNVTSWIDSSYGGYHVMDPSNSVDLNFKLGLYTFNGRILPHIKGIDVSFNRLTGTIPVQLTRLKGIFLLNMSKNLLTGKIPSSLGNLTELECLDLSHNNLLGAIPPELTALVFLEVFNVFFNNLSGMIPMIAQFATFDNSSYLGNPGLCGSPHAIKCNNGAETPPVYASAEKSVISYIFCCIGVSFLFFV